MFLRKRIRSERRQRAAHAIIAIRLFIESYERYTHSHIAAISIATLGLPLLAYAWFHPRLHHWKGAGHLETGVLLVETLVLAITTAELFAEGKRRVPCAYLVPTLFYLYLAICQHRENIRQAAQQPVTPVPLT